jgi:TRAP-type uncharacterized transport system fused permease subunit
MGLPTTANYVVTATIAAPILLSQFDVPIIVAHMFVFYFGILADITPPVCLAAYAGSGIAGSNPMKTGVTALRIAIAGFIIPFAFVLQPELLLEDATAANLAPILAMTLLGLVAISSGLSGYLVRNAGTAERVLLVGAGVALISPNLVVSMLGLATLVGVGVWQWGVNRSQPAPATRTESSDEV